MRALILLGLAACGTNEAVDRPHDVHYVTKTILAPNCGLAGCHSTFVQTDGLVFDTVEAVKIVTRFDLTNPDPEQAPRLIGAGGRDDQPIISFLKSVTNTKGSYQMPLDGPMPGTDIDTLLDFFAAGAPGACEPEPDFCRFSAAVHSCGPDDNYEITDCRTIKCGPTNNIDGHCMDGACVCP